MKHTKGNWKISNYEIPNEYNQPELSDFEIVCEDGGAICVLWPKWRPIKNDAKHRIEYDGEQTEANAKLIVAAPDLLEALQNLTNIYIGLMDELDRGFGKYNPREDINIISAVKAIKKATS